MRRPPLTMFSVLLLWPASFLGGTLQESGKPTPAKRQAVGRLFSPTCTLLQGTHAVVELVLDKRSPVAIGRLNSWPAGTPFFTQLRKGHEPVTSLFFVVVKGKAEVGLDGPRHYLQAPAMFQLDLSPQLAG